MYVEKTDIYEPVDFKYFIDNSGISINRTWHVESFTCVYNLCLCDIYVPTLSYYVESKKTVYS